MAADQCGRPSLQPLPTVCVWVDLPRTDGPRRTGPVRRSHLLRSRGCTIVSETGFKRAGRRYGPILGMDLLCLERRGAPFFSRSMYITREVGCNHRTYPLQGIPHTQALNFRDICGGGGGGAATAGGYCAVVAHVTSRRAGRRTHSSGNTFSRSCRHGVGSGGSLMRLNSERLFLNIVAV